MISSLLHRVLSAELNKFGKDASGNLVISPQSLGEIVSRVTEIVAKSLSRPVVTVGLGDIIQIARSSGFQAHAEQQGDVLTYSITRGEGAEDQFEEVTKLIDLTVQFTLEKVNKLTRIEEEN